jgi:hypothetical protein
MILTAVVKRLTLNNFQNQELPLEKSQNKKNKKMESTKKKRVKRIKRTKKNIKVPNRCLIKRKLLTK